MSWENYAMFRTVMLAIIRDVLEKDISTPCRHMEVDTYMIRNRIYLSSITGLEEADREVDELTRGKEWVDVKDLLKFSYRPYSFSYRSGIGEETSEMGKTLCALYSAIGNLESLERQEGRNTDNSVSSCSLPEFLDGLITASSLIRDLREERLIICHNDPMLGRSFWEWNLDEREKIEKMREEGLALSQPFSNELIIYIFRKMFIEIFPAPMPINWDLVKRMIKVS